MTIKVTENKPLKANMLTPGNLYWEINTSGERENIALCTHDRIESGYLIIHFMSHGELLYSRSETSPTLYQKVTNGTTLIITQEW